jgi:hypothetical protein
MLVCQLPLRYASRSLPEAESSYLMHNKFTSEPYRIRTLWWCSRDPTLPVQGHTNSEIEFRCFLQAFLSPY